MRKTYCSVCGKMMNEKIDENSGKPFKIQMSSVSCINEAWHNVTEALKKGVRPEWVYICNGEQPQPQSRSNNKRYIYHNRIVFLQNQGFTIKEISKELNIAVATVYGSLKQYGNEMI